MALAEALRTSSSLYALDLSNVHMGVQGLVAVCSAMGAEGEGNTSVQVMDIGAPIIHMQQVGHGIVGEADGTKRTPAPSCSSKHIESMVTPLGCGLPMWPWQLSSCVV